MIGAKLFADEIGSGSVYIGDLVDNCRVASAYSVAYWTLVEKNSRVIPLTWSNEGPLTRELTPVRAQAPQNFSYRKFY